MSKSFDLGKLREFGLVIGLGFPFLLGWLIPSIYGHSFGFWTIFISIPFLLISFIKPMLLKYPYKFWMGLGHFLGLINSNIILGLVYIIILLPISFLMRLTNKYDPLRLKNNNNSSYREERRNHKINLKKIF